MKLVVLSSFKQAISCVILACHRLLWHRQVDEKGNTYIWWVYFTLHYNSDYQSYRFIVPWGCYNCSLCARKVAFGKTMYSFSPILQKSTRTSNPVVAIYEGSYPTVGNQVLVLCPWFHTNIMTWRTFADLLFTIRQKQRLFVQFSIE